ncbi:MAG: hypothetical protein K2P81_00465 [Bacteriovoracaceae bacterium]|nr:hypothetical protein [Bacteriovoracaceae bacterium]
MKKRFSYFLICFSLMINGSQAQIISADTALLVELVTTTASQLNELEKLLSNAEKYTAKMQQYNELVQDEYFRAERILYLVESLAAKKEIQGLGDVNNAIRDLKYSMADLQAMMKEYSIIIDDEKKTKAIVKTQKNFNEKKAKLAEGQVKKSINAKTSGRATQLTAQNTALMLESNVDMHNTQLDMLEKVSTTNRLLAEQMEEKRREELEKKKTYNIGREIK